MYSNSKALDKITGARHAKEQAETELFLAIWSAYHDKGETVSIIAAKANVTRQTIYRWLNTTEEADTQQ